MNPVNIKKVDINGRQIQVKSLTWKDFKVAFGTISTIILDAVNDNLNPGAYLEDATFLMSKMSDIPVEEIENMRPSDALKILNTCIEVILEDKDFLQEVQKILKTIKKVLGSTT